MALIWPVVSAARINPAARSLIRDAAQDAKNSTVAADEAGLVTIAGSIAAWSKRRQVERVAWGVPVVPTVANNLPTKK